MNNALHRQEHDGILPLALRVATQEEGASAPSSSSMTTPPPTHQDVLPRGAGDTGHYLSTGPSFSSLATNGSTIVAQIFPPASVPAPMPAPASAAAEETASTWTGASAGAGALNEPDRTCHQAGVGEEYTAPLDAPEQQQQQRRIPRTNSYYRRAGMTSRLDDLHYLANAPSFSSISTAATSVASRMSLMGGNSRFDHRQPSFLGGNTNTSNTGTISRPSSGDNDHFPAPATTSNNSSAGTPGTRPAAENIFLRQDDPEYQNLLTSIATSTVVVGRQPNTGDRCGRHPTTSAADTSRLQQQQQQQQQQVASSSSCGMLSLHRRRSSSALGSSQPSSTRRVASSSSLRRSSSTSAGSILRRGRYSSGFLASVREDQEESCNGAQDNNHNATFNNNSVKFTAPTIHHIGGEGQSDHQHLDDKEQTIENSGDFDDDEQIPECILAAFAGETPSSDPQGGRRPSTCSSLSDQEQSVQDKQPKGDDMKKRSEKPLQIPQEVTSVGRYYEDDELDEYLFTGIESLQMDDEDNAAGAKLGTTASSHKSSGHTSSRRYQSAESMSSISTLESTGKRSVISQPPAR